MLAQAFKAIPAIAFVFISMYASAQPYNQPANDRSTEQNSPLPVPPAATHMQISVRQQLAGSLKFRVAVFNPFTKPAAIMICKDGDVLYTENGVKGQYENMFNLDQLEDGNYQIVITSGKETVSKDINIHTETVTEDRIAQIN